MLPEERRSRIARQVAEAGAASVAELSRLFGVAEETIRRDLRALEAAGVLRRTHGGALRVDSPPGGLPQGPARGPAALAAAPYAARAGAAGLFAVREAAGPVAFPVAPFSERASQNRELKAAIARAALELVQDGDTIFLDSGSTVLELAKLLACRRELVVVTHSLKAAAQLAEAPHISVNVVGGTLRPQELALVGPEARRALERMRAAKAFMACAGFGPAFGATVSDVLEADIKRAMVESAAQAILLADHTKWERPSLVSYAGLERFSAVVSDAGLPGEARERLKALGVHVVIAENS